MQMIRRLFTAASLVSLLLCMTMVLLWVRSYTKTDEVHATHAHWVGPASCHVEGALYWADRGRFALLLSVGDSTFSSRNEYELSEVVRGNRFYTPEGRSIRWTHPPLSQLLQPTKSLRSESQIDSHGMLLNVHFGPYRAKLTGNTICTGSRREFDFIGPFWIIVVLSAIPCSVRIFVESRRRRRTARGACQTCGYDLRASTDRCPECGTPTAAKPKKVTV